MNLGIDKKLFDGIIYAAAGYSSSVFDAVQVEIHNCENQLDLTLFEEGKKAAGSDKCLMNDCRIYVCSDAFLRRLRHFDLVLTDSGFGVVSSDHQAPASRERVNALEAQLKRRKEEAYCDILQSLVQVSGWGNNPMVRHLFPTVVYHVREAEELTGKSDISADEWAALKRKFFDAEFKICGCTGQKFMEELIHCVMTNTSSDIQKTAIVLVKQTMATMVVNDDNKPVQKEAVRRLLDWLEDNKDSFSSYTNSKEYAARHAETYQNKKDSPVFFFG